MARTRRRNRAILGAVVVLVLAAGAAVAFSLAYRQARTNDRTNKAAQAELRAAEGVPVAGVVTSVNAAGVTVRMPTGAIRRLAFGPSTVVESARTGAVSDVKLGLRAQVTFTPGLINVASRVVVLPRTSPLGEPIAKAGFGRVWLRPRGAPLGPGIKIARASIANAVPATRADIKRGDVVIAHARTTTTKPIKYIANEIVLLASVANTG